MNEGMQQQMPPPPPIGSTIRKLQPKNLMHAMNFKGVLDWEECEWLIDYFQQNEDMVQDARIGGMNQLDASDNGRQDDNTRKVKVLHAQPGSFWELNPQIMNKLYEFCSNVNDEHFGYDINMMSQIDILEYTPGDHYIWHNDSGDTGLEAGMRKLTFTFELSDTDDYEGGQLVLGKDYLQGLANGKTEEEMLESLAAQKEQGMAVAFSSFMLHKVYPLTEGKRYAMVIWMNGPRWK